MVQEKSGESNPRLYIAEVGLMFKILLELPPQIDRDLAYFKNVEFWWGIFEVSIGNAALGLKG